MRFILGSSSPRRKEILGYFSIPFEQISPVFDEEAVPFNGDPEDYVNTLSRGKSDSLASLYPNALLITADTVVYKEGKIYNKPKDEEEAFCIITELANSWHSVYTSVTVRRGNEVFTKAEETRVLFNSLSPSEIRHYHRAIHWADKAGGYGISGSGGLIVKRIEGCYYNTVGLPINTLRDLLTHMGINLWTCLA